VDSLSRAALGDVAVRCSQVSRDVARTVCTDVDLACSAQTVSINQERRIAGVEQLIGFDQTVKKRLKGAFGQAGEENSRLVQEENRTLMRVGTLL